MAPSQPREQPLEEEGGRPAARKAMGFLSFVGRALFASIFLLSAMQDVIQFASDEGTAAAKSLGPKYDLFIKQMSITTRMAMPHVQVKTFILVTIYLRGFGGPLLILYSSFGAFLLIVYLAFITPVLYDFYNYELESPQYAQLFTQFSQNLAFCGALIFFIGMKNSIPRRHSKRRMAKTKTT